MIELRPGTPAELPAQRVLWQQVFGDSDLFIDCFYESCARAEDMMVLLEDGVLRSMLALLPLGLTLPDGGRADAYYIYALATDPNARKQGFAQQLLNYVDFYLQERGADCVTVVPAEAGLHRFFAMAGFREGFATRKLELPAAQVLPPKAGDSIAPIGPEEYGAIRCKALSEAPHAVYPPALLAFQAKASALEGGGLYRILAGGQEGCAAVEPCDRDSLVLKELVIAPEAMAAALAQVDGLFSAARYHVRTPALWDGLPGSYRQEFAMVKWYREEKRLRWGEELSGYFGLGFD
ncbi:MAG: GNAT family N-acetyltransferase [Pseudoflavonifractor sp.]